MYQSDVVLCAASAYTQKYYLNDDFAYLPIDVKKELRIMCTLFTVDVGGIITLFFDEEGHLLIRTEADEGDVLYDEIGSVMKVKQLRRDKAELFESLELFYQTFF